jgi:CRISPR-associated endonuclease/helicase Cas3
LLAHLLDAAATAEAMWDRVLPAVVRDDLADGLGIPTTAARSWVTFLAALHDLGKVCPAFQLRPEAGALRERYERWGGPLSSDGRVPHGYVTAQAGRELLADPPFSLTPNVAQELAALTAGHHGLFPTPDEMLHADPRLVGREPWRSARLTIGQSLGPLLDLPADRPSRLHRAAAMVLAGLISVADWIASDDTFFPYASDIDNPDQFPDPGRYLKGARQRAHEALSQLGWFGWSGDQVFRSFSDLFPAIVQPRPLQTAASQLADTLRSDNPELIVVEAPMGEGKTEAALCLVSGWSRVTGRRGFYVALPTQATSNQMFGRVLAFLRSQPHLDRVQLQLLHGHAAFSGDFELLRKDGLRLAHPVRVSVDDESADAVVASGWFTHRKRGLLAPYGVGTVDQALLAALQLRHGFVRLFGLVRRAVIIDEVHAYDTYMSTLLERLLEWLAAIRAPVILLSATLPSVRRTALCQAYTRGAGHATLPPPPPVAYPRLTRVRGADVTTVPFPSSAQSQRRLHLRWLDGALGSAASTGIAALLSEHLSPGGCAAIVCNTVGRAQDMYRSLQAAWSGASDDGLPRLELLHARFPFRDREIRERRVISRFGPPGGRRPTQAVVVATQIVEQSLDVDFDLMVSDMAPVDLLLQRSGRLHRHARPRPTACAEPVLNICQPATSDEEVPQFDAGTAAVYDAHVLLRSWLALADRNQVEIPADLQALIDLVYADDGCWPHPLPAPIEAALARTWQALQDDRRIQREEAEKRWVRSPVASVPVWAYSRDPREEDAPELHQSFQALTRLAPPSVQVVCLHGHADQITLDPSGAAPLALSGVPSPTTTCALLERSLSIQHQGLVHALLEQPVPAGWRQSALLRHSRPVPFDETATAHVGTYRLQLDAELGLVISRV